MDNSLKTILRQCRKINKLRRKIAILVYNKPNLWSDVCDALHDLRIEDNLDVIIEAYNCGKASKDTLDLAYRNANEMSRIFEFEYQQNGEE